MSTEGVPEPPPPTGTPAAPGVAPSTPPPPPSAEPGVQYSPDGRWWWDGSQWLPAPGPPPPAPSVAPGVQYSPDGRWWWNGWQWTPATGPPPAAAHNRVTAALFAILLGDFGAHKFYLGDTNRGILYLVFFWTFIPGLIGLVEGIQYLTMSDPEFARRYP